MVVARFELCLIRWHTQLLKQHTSLCFNTCVSLSSQRELYVGRLVDLRARPIGAVSSDGEPAVPTTQSHAVLASKCSLLGRHTLVRASTLRDSGDDKKAAARLVADPRRSSIALTRLKAAASDCCTAVLGTTQRRSRRCRRRLAGVFV